MEPYRPINTLKQVAEEIGGPIIAFRYFGPHLGYSRLRRRHSPF